MGTMNGMHKRIGEDRSDEVHLVSESGEGKCHINLIDDTSVPSKSDRLANDLMRKLSHFYLTFQRSTHLAPQLLKRLAFCGLDCYNCRRYGVTRLEPSLRDAHI